MLKFIFTTFLCIVMSVLHSQSGFKKNDIYIELGGNSLFTALNYERQLGKKPGFGVRAGVGIYGITPSYYSFPIGLNYLMKLRMEGTFLEFGAGVTMTKADVLLYAVAKREFDIKPPLAKFVPSLAYRIHTEKNMMLRFSITPVVTSLGLLPFFGISAGKRF